MSKSRIVDIEYMEDDQCRVCIQKAGEQEVQPFDLACLIESKVTLRTLSLEDLARIQQLVTDSTELQPLAKLQFWIFCKLQNLSHSINNCEDEAKAYATPVVDDRDHDW